MDVYVIIITSTTHKPQSEGVHICAVVIHTETAQTQTRSKSINTVRNHFHQGRHTILPVLGNSHGVFFWPSGRRTSVCTCHNIPIAPQRVIFFKDITKHKKQHGIFPGLPETFTALLGISGASLDPAYKPWMRSELSCSQPRSDNGAPNTGRV